MKLKNTNELLVPEQSNTFNTIIKMNTEISREIDEIVYKLYGITEEERKIIEGMR